MVQSSRGALKGYSKPQSESRWWLEDEHEESVLGRFVSGLGDRAYIYDFRSGRRSDFGMSSESGWTNDPSSFAPAKNVAALSPRSTESIENIHQRLANANDYFKRKATEVVSDDNALKLLATLYKAVVVDISEFDACEDGLSLAKLTAANFCEVGANVIYITESGQRFIDSIKDA